MNRHREWTQFPGGLSGKPFNRASSWTKVPLYWRPSLWKKQKTSAIRLQFRLMGNLYVSAVLSISKGNMDLVTISKWIVKRLIIISAERFRRNSHNVLNYRKGKYWDCLSNSQLKLFRSTRCLSICNFVCINILVFFFKNICFPYFIFMILLTDRIVLYKVILSRKNNEDI